MAQRDDASMSNRLATETSPYLLQHKDNPVDWWPWGDEALERARSEQKPILLSVGYAACHWCHVMERESFEDEATAAVMNEHFVSIKVDREERPDIDSVYMEAVQTMTGRGGWPMTVFLTPEGVPFYGGTYFPPEDRYGMPSFQRLLAAIAELWEQRQQEAHEQGQKLMEHIGAISRLAPSNDPITDVLLRESFRVLRQTFDTEWGGFGDAPKFPQPMVVDLLLRLGARGRDEALDMANHTLDAMAAGGMFDQLGGGFARYSVDRAWTVPHFEKMLYDNAQLLRTYARAWQIGGQPRYRDVAESTAGWMLREMRDPAGGFWSSLDADSEGAEGKYYVWDLAGFRAAAGEDADEAIGVWGITAQGNFEGSNIPIFARDGDRVSTERARARLLEARSERVRPATDAKVLTAWNALAAAALAEAGSVLGRKEWVTAAVETMDFVMDQLVVDGRLMRSYRNLDGRTDVRHLGFAEDHAFVVEACLALFEATFETKWLTHARWAADEVIRLFLDEDKGGFFTTGADAEALITRSKDLIDNAIPSANSVLALELQRLALITGEQSYERHALGVVRLMKEAMTRSPGGFGHLLGAVDFYTSTPLEIVIVGEPSAPDTHELVEVIHGNFLPNRVIIVGTDETSTPLLQNKTKDAGRATAYVCRRGVCKRPVTSAADLATELLA
jgi:uncharacterized protein YyaL (SSP411 family)